MGTRVPHYADTRVQHASGDLEQVEIYTKGILASISGGASQILSESHAASRALDASLDRSRPAKTRKREKHLT